MSDETCIRPKIITAIVLFKAHQRQGGLYMEYLHKMLPWARLPIRTLASPTPCLSVQPTPLSTRRLDHVALAWSPGYFQTRAPARLGHSLLHRWLQLPLRGCLTCNGVREFSALASASRNLLAFRTHGGQCRGDMSSLATGGGWRVCSVPHLLARCYSSPQESKGNPKGV